MKKNDNWSQSFAPLNTAECDPVRIAGSVREKINAEKGRNITMKTNKRRIKPLVIAAAVAATVVATAAATNRRGTEHQKKRRPGASFFLCAKQEKQAFFVQILLTFAGYAVKYVQ